MAFETGIRVKIDASGAKRGAEQVKRAFANIKDAARRDMSIAKRSVAGLGTAFGRIKSSILSVKGAMIGLGGAFVARKLVGEFADFERGLIAVGKTTGLPCTPSPRRSSSMPARRHRAPRQQLRGDRSGNRGSDQARGSSRCPFQPHGSRRDGPGCGNEGTGRGGRARCLHGQQGVARHGGSNRGRRRGDGILVAHHWQNPRGDGSTI